MTTPSAKDFQGPLLQVLGDLTGCTAGVPVRGSDTYTGVMTLMGIADINAHGVEAPSGTPMVQRWISWACKNLRNTGHIDLEGRGMWMLTPKGVQELSGMTTATVAAPVIPVAPVAVPARPRHLDDPYIRKLVLAQTPCLGHYTPHRGAVCVTCPIVAECRDIQNTAFAKAAADLDAADAKAALAASLLAAGGQSRPAAPAPVAAPVTATPAVTQAARQTSLNRDSAMKILAFEEVICTECGLTIKRDEYMVWVEDTNGTGLTAHVACFEAAQ